METALWFCCLHPRERNVLRTTALALVETLWIGVPTGLWDTFWLASPDVTDDVKLAFRIIFGLEIVTIEEGDDEISVIRPAAGYLGYWVSWSLFVVTPAAACLAGCEQSRVP